VKDRSVKDVGWGWVETPTPDMSRRLSAAGYSVGGYLDVENGKKPRFVLYRTDPKFTKVHDFETIEELNNMLKLLLPPEGED
jgi:hypothetical protein